MKLHLKSTIYPVAVALMTGAQLFAAPSLMLAQKRSDHWANSSPPTSSPGRMMT